MDWGYLYVLYCMYEESVSGYPISKKNKGFYMSALVLLNLLKEMGKKLLDARFC